MASCSSGFYFYSIIYQKLVQIVYLNRYGNGLESNPTKNSASWTIKDFW